MLTSTQATCALLCTAHASRMEFQIRHATEQWRHPLAVGVLHSTGSMQSNATNRTRLRVFVEGAVRQYHPAGGDPSVAVSEATAARIRSRSNDSSIAMWSSHRQPWQQTSKAPRRMPSRTAAASSGSRSNAWVAVGVQSWHVMGQLSARSTACTMLSQSSWCTS